MVWSFVEFVKGCDQLWNLSRNPFRPTVIDTTTVKTAQFLLPTCDWKLWTTCNLGLKVALHIWRTNQNLLLMGGSLLWVTPKWNPFMPVYPNWQWAFIKSSLVTWYAEQYPISLEGYLIQVGNGIELEAIGLQFKPYLWLPCGVTWDSSQTVVVIKLQLTSALDIDKVAHPFTWSCPASQSDH